MSRKEEILHDHVDPHCFLKPLCDECVLDAMDEYAKEQIIAFEIWRIKTGYEFQPNGYYSKEHPMPGVQTWFTLDEVFAKFVEYQYIQSLTK